MKTIEIYTDGACSGNPGNGGWSAVLYTNNERVVMCGYDEYTTNNRMELYGLINGLEMAINSPDIKPGTVINLYTDSKYVENPINLKWIQKWVDKEFEGIKNSDLWSRVYELLELVNINIVWIPREKNSVADLMAKNARDGLYGIRATMIME